jgi:hypothetical protein
LDQNGPKIQKAEKHRDRISNLWRYLRLSATPKTHLVEGHAIGLCEKHGGFGGLGEDEGKRAHQTGAKDEKRYGGMSEVHEPIREDGEELWSGCKKEGIEKTDETEIQEPTKVSRR